MAFIRAHTQLVAVPHAPEIVLHLATEATPLWLKTEEELGEIGLPPPFWAFAWAGGQALARHLLDHPSLVAGKRVLDFGSGSGLAGIAAAKAGAASVVATDIDSFALAAMALNADANGVTLEIEPADLVGTQAGWDVVLAGDVCYERDMATSATAWLEGLGAGRRDRAHRRPRPGLSAEGQARGARRLPGRDYPRTGGSRGQANHRVAVRSPLSRLNLLRRLAPGRVLDDLPHRSGVAGMSMWRTP